MVNWLPLLAVRWSRWLIPSKLVSSCGPLRTTAPDCTVADPPPFRAAAWSGARLRCAPGARRGRALCRDGATCAEAPPSVASGPTSRGISVAIEAGRPEPGPRTLYEAGAALVTWGAVGGEGGGGRTSREEGEGGG